MTKPRILAEVCIETAADAVAAAEGGADRLELCADLTVGGLTPSLDAVHEVLGATPLPVVAMVRCRDGDFHYASDELVGMDKQAQTLLAMGAVGIVFGAVDVEGMPQAEALRRLRAAADRASRGRAELVFHRAFDAMPDKHAALDLLVDCGVDRVLTSGHPDGVAHGMNVLADLSPTPAGASPSCRGAASAPTTSPGCCAAPVPRRSTSAPAPSRPCRPAPRPSPHSWASRARRPSGMRRAARASLRP